MRKKSIRKEIHKEMKSKYNRKSYKEPIYRMIKFNGKDIELKVYFKDGQFVAEFQLMPQTVFGTGPKITTAIDEAVKQLYAFVNRCSDSIANGIPLIPEIYDAYKYLIESN